MFDIITLGDAVSDLFIKPEELSIMCPASKIKERTCFEPVLCLGYGEKISIEDIHYDIGGSAANVAVGLARQGFKVGFIGAVGRDSKGAEILARLKEEGVSPRFLKKIKEIKTNFSLIFSYKGERTILVYRGLVDYSQISIPKNLSTKWLFIGPLGEGFEKLYSQIISLVCQKNIKLALNPGRIQIKKGGSALKEILPVSKVLFLNKEEAEEICLTKRPALLKDLLASLKAMGPEIIFITDGSEGAYSFDGEEYLKISAYRADRKEVTGAGDAFSAGALGALVLGKDTKEALQWGVINSASVIEKIGAQNGLLSLPQIQRRLKGAPYPRPI